MLRLAACLVFSALLLAPTECGNRTFFSVRYVLFCHKFFTYSATLFEHDTLGNDVIARESKKDAEDEAAGNLTGYQTSDGILDGEYEIFIRIEHTCGNNPRVADRWLKMPVCKVDTGECIFQEQRWEL